MFNKFGNFLAIALAIYSSLDLAEGASISGVSWIYQGTAQQNNSALTFNLYDTLNLICKSSGSGISSQLVYAISKGTTPTGMTLTTTGSLTIKNVGTLVYSDVDGIQKGYENFVVTSGPYNLATNISSNYLSNDFRYVSVGTLKTTDSATYVCSSAYFNGTALSVTDANAGLFGTSGSLTITVNTKSGQALSARTQVNSFLTYSASIIGAFKFIF